MFVILLLCWQKEIIFQQVKKKKFERDLWFQKQRLRAAVFRKIVKKYLYEKKIIEGFPLLYKSHLSE